MAKGKKGGKPKKSSQKKKARARRPKAASRKMKARKPKVKARKPKAAKRRAPPRRAAKRKPARRAVRRTKARPAPKPAVPRIILAPPPKPPPTTSPVARIEPLPLHEKTLMLPKPPEKPEAKPASKPAPAPQPVPAAQPPQIKPVIAPIAPKPAAAAPKPAPPPEAKPAPAVQPGAVQPALDVLPVWEDRLRLQRWVSEQGITFMRTAKGSAEEKAALAMLPPQKKAQPLPGHFIVCARDRAGKTIGALDGYDASADTLVICRSAVSGEKRHELHILLYAAALAGAKPAYVLFATAKGRPPMELAVLLITLGRGFGMSAMHVEHPDSYFFIRRVGKEHDPLSSGPELAAALRALQSACAGSLEQQISQLGESVAALIPLPVSPDTREQLHELRDAANILGLQPGTMDAALETLRVDYVIGRKDISPEKIF